MKPSLKLRFKRAFTENVGLKIMALLFSVGLWLVVVNVDNPNQSKTFTVPVTVVNEEVLTEAGRYYTIPDGANTVRFRVTAKRSVIEKLTSQDFTATADLNYLENDSRIPVTVIFNGSYPNVTISSKKLYLHVEVGNDMMVKQEVVVEPQGTLEDGCVISETTVDPNSITMTGPEEILSQVAKVVAYIDVDGANQDRTEEGIVLHFIDKNGNEMDRSRITVDADTVSASVHILRVKQVDVNVETSGNLPSGTYLDGVSSNPSKVKIMGSASQLNNVTAITVPGSVVDLSKIQSTTTTTVDLNAYLPEGVTVAEGESSQAEISIKVSGNTTKEFTVPTSNITVRNLGEELESSFDDEELTLTVAGSKDDLAALSAENITGYVDASGLSAGKQTLQLNLELDDSKYTVDTVTVKVTIKQK